VIGRLDILRPYSRPPGSPSGQLCNASHDQWSRWCSVSLHPCSIETGLQLISLADQASSQEAPFWAMSFLIYNRSVSVFWSALFCFQKLCPSWASFPARDSLQLTQTDLWTTTFCLCALLWFSLGFNYRSLLLNFTEFRHAQSGCQSIVLYLVKGLDPLMPAATGEAASIAGIKVQLTGAVCSGHQTILRRWHSLVTTASNWAWRSFIVRYRAVFIGAWFAPMHWQGLRAKGAGLRDVAASTHYRAPTSFGCRTVKSAE